jgi:bifunctional DNA-binding transcriptional regulator/antitoxin component of YhaV-PrlF toxin-antitoxin module
MTKTRITSGNRTTVPQKIREALGARPGDILNWEVLGDHARITVATDFLSLQGRFSVGPGDPVGDVRRAREMMGDEDR